MIEYMKEKIEPATLRDGYNKRLLKKEEMTLLRQLTGMINWAGLIIRGAGAVQQVQEWQAASPEEGQQGN